MAKLLGGLRGYGYGTDYVCIPVSISWQGVASYSVGDEKRTAMLSMGEYKWTEMLPAYSGDSYSSEQAAAVAKLMFHCGCVAGMNYSLDGSGASLQDAAAGMKKHFGYLTQYYGYKDYPQTNNYDDAAWKRLFTGN